jgi:hypothetical protein
MRLVGFFLFYCGIKTGKVIVRMCTGRCRQILSIVVPMIFGEVQLSNGNERYAFLSSKFPSSSMQGKIRRQRNLLFSTKFPGEI